MTKGHGEKKTRMTEPAIIALLTEPTLKEAAKKVGISEATLWRWMQEPEFKEAFRDAKKQSVSQAVSQLQQSSGEAVQTLRDVMGDGAAPHSSKVSAAKTILDMALKAVETEELEARIEELEKQLGGSDDLKGAR